MSVVDSVREAIHNKCRPGKKFHREGDKLLDKKVNADVQRKAQDKICHRCIFEFGTIFEMEKGCVHVFGHHRHLLPWVTQGYLSIVSFILDTLHPPFHLLDGRTWFESAAMSFRHILRQMFRHSHSISIQKFSSLLTPSRWSRSKWYIQASDTTYFSRRLGMTH